MFALEDREKTVRRALNGLCALLEPGVCRRAVRSNSEPKRVWRLLAAWTVGTMIIGRALHLPARGSTDDITPSAVVSSFSEAVLRRLRTLRRGPAES